MKKQLIVTAAAFALGLTGCLMSTPSASAKTTYLPSYIRHHTFYRLTDGSQGGYHDKTTFKGNHMSLHSSALGHYTWRLSGLKKHSSKVYYGRIHYSKKSSAPIKIKIFNKKHFDFIPKHIGQLKGNYTGDESFGATIFKR
ncbi:hypothetical protein [Levilactobacillus acidifarinae]|uniref:Lipoprotein n=1 Tax=Levilactobacillus acidifarinae DSM 19394 = JCM 15949 TaxID=1423715 RepID=A0A0R1LJE7_9LACO|nr:hypothetical protein [Levilactobacillus acidifarinae]KRK96076.1 hypothetical protein FD25_GL002539 [Levilactobacillus acidifarinae DSM 19394]GEO69650.1 hypothetical protein LAC03_15600 [Levilactobacillus acidifarinae]